MSTKSKTISISRRTDRGRQFGFAICIRNDGYEVSLEPRKIYTTLPDSDAAANGQIRVVDESGDDYLFPSELFLAVELPPTVRRALAMAI